MYHMYQEYTNNFLKIISKNHSEINKCFQTFLHMSLLNFVPCVRACQRGLRANVLACHHGLRVDLPACQHAKSVPTSHFYLPTCQ